MRETTGTGTRGEWTLTNMHEAATMLALGVALVRVAVQPDGYAKCIMDNGDGMARAIHEQWRAGGFDILCNPVELDTCYRQLMQAMRDARERAGTPQYRPARRTA